MIKVLLFEKIGCLIFSVPILTYCVTCVWIQEKFESLLLELAFYIINTEFIFLRSLHLCQRQACFNEFR